jgi:hypothetical protein
MLKLHGWITSNSLPWGSVGKAITSNHSVQRLLVARSSVKKYFVRLSEDAQDQDGPELSCGTAGDHLFERWPTVRILSRPALPLHAQVPELQDSGGQNVLLIGPCSSVNRFANYAPCPRFHRFPAEMCRASADLQFSMLLSFFGHRQRYWHARILEKVASVVQKGFVDRAATGCTNFYEVGGPLNTWIAQ